KNSERYRIHALSLASGGQRRERRGRADARRRSYRPARRSALFAQGQCLVLRVRGSRNEQAARLQFAGRSHRPLSAILLGHRVATHSERNPLSQSDLKRSTVGGKSLQQCVSRRTRPHALRAAALESDFPFHVQQIASVSKRGGRERNTHARAMEQICSDCRAPAWSARPRIAAKKRNGRYSFPRGGAGGGEVRR